MHVVLPLPPSDNKLYFNRGGIRIKTKEAEKYIKEVQQIMAHKALEAEEDFEENVPYGIVITVYFKATTNKGWPEKTKRRFKRVDCQNRQKLVTDIVTKCLGVDDHHIFSSHVLKEEDTKNPRVEVVIRRL